MRTVKRQSERAIDQIIIHVSDSPDSRSSVDAAEIKRWHLEKGWSDIGYHYVIKRNGEIEKGRPDSKAGAHAKGYNYNSLGICWVGRNSITNEQEESLVNLTLRLLRLYNLPIVSAKGHYEVADSDKTCPNIDMDKFRKLLRDEQA